ncbi:helix-turn-helix domain-containing protein [Candidatus Agathobaculum pullicola]|uniref:helix-turn-helix domain-containing protein n=1 Tax=Candidatus Agathobaculum pullicola TaxID=2838426 RepID=UPI003F905E0A
MQSRKLNDDDISRAKTMRKNGDSLQKIADSLGVSRQWIWVIIHRDDHVTYQKKILNRVIYPAIRNYLYKNRVSITQFSFLNGISIFADVAAIRKRR